MTSSSAETLLVFADESAVVYEPVAAGLVIGEAPYWIAQCSFYHRPDGCFFMLRAGAAALQWLDSILDALRYATEVDANRWSHFELEGIAATPNDQPLGSAQWSSLLFTPYGLHLPELPAFILSLNPTVHRNVHDGRVTGRFIEYLNAVQARGGRLYDDIDETPITGAAFEVINPGGAVALITAYTPNIALYATISERNVTAYCRRNGYTHYIYRDTPAHLSDKMSGNWVKAALLLRHFDAHEQVAWIDADILIHSADRDIDEITRGQPFTFARDVSGFQFNSGFMVFRAVPECRDFLEQVQAKIDAVDDKRGVYASGGDQPAFVSTWEESGGQAAMPLSDCVSSNSHPALYDADSFMIHYMGYPDRFRAVVMRADALEIEHSAAGSRETDQSPYVSTAGRHGTFFVYRYDTHVGRSLQLYGEWSEPEIALFGQIVTAGDVVIEAGANVGAHTVWLSKQVGAAGNVIAFEPARHTFQLLCANLALNDCLNVSAHQQAVTDSVGEVAFPLLDPRREANFGGATLKAPGLNATEAVRCITLDALRLPRIDFIKADVEGCELDLLAGSEALIKQHRPAVYIEINDAEVRDRAVEFFEARGYSCWYYITPLFTPQNWHGKKQDVLGGYSFDMLCVPDERYRVTGTPRAGVDDDLVRYRDGMIQWVNSDWRLSRVHRYEQRTYSPPISSDSTL